MATTSPSPNSSPSAISPESTPPPPQPSSPPPPQPSSPQLAPLTTPSSDPNANPPDLVTPPPSPPPQSPPTPNLTSPPPSSLSPPPLLTVSSPTPAASLPSSTTSPPSQSVSPLPANVPPPSSNSPPPPPLSNPPAISPPPPSSNATSPPPPSADPPAISPPPPSSNPPTGSPPPPLSETPKNSPPPPQSKPPTSSPTPPSSLPPENSPPPPSSKPPESSPPPPASKQPPPSPASMPPIASPPPPPSPASMPPISSPPPPPGLNSSSSTPSASPPIASPPPPPGLNSSSSTPSASPPSSNSPPKLLSPPPPPPPPIMHQSPPPPLLLSPPSPPPPSQVPDPPSSNLTTNNSSANAPEISVTTGSGGFSTGGTVAIGLALSFLLLSLIGIAAWCIRRQKKKVSGINGGYILPTSSSYKSDSALLKAQSLATHFGSSSGSDIVYSPSEPGGLGSSSRSWFTYEELVEATNGFSVQNLLGEGGFGCVYKGYLADGREVAVKQLNIGGGQGEREFKAEVEIISRIHHRYLVSLVGYCISEKQRLLVYDYVPNNTLYFHLHGEGRPVMDWATRVKIASGAARGIAYLHEDCHPRIIHRDIKSANILLDNNFEARVSDFGLAKLALDANTHITTRVIGTFGYMAPEYASSGKLTEKSDVFSFGVVLLELITGRKSVDPSQPLGEESLVEWQLFIDLDPPFVDSLISTRQLFIDLDPLFVDSLISTNFSMDSEVSSSRKKVKEKVDPSKPRRLWSPREEQCLINALMHIVNNGMKQDNAFKAGYLMKLEEKLLEMLPGTNLRGTPHIESKIKIWKKHYNCVAGMLGTSGFGWNDTEKRIDVESDSVWEAYVRRESDAKNLRNKSFPYFDSWIHIFGKDRATGEFAEGPADAVDAINAEEELLFNSLADDGTFLEHMGISSHIGEGINCSSSSSQRPPESSAKKNDNKKRPRGNDDVVEGLSMIANKLGEVFSATNEKLDFIGRRMGYEHDLASKRASLNDELIKLPIALDERLDACEIISQSAQKLDMFFSLTHDDKLRWVMRLLRRSAP